jgi:hypothetical protein
LRIASNRDNDPTTRSSVDPDIRGAIRLTGDIDRTKAGTQHRLSHRFTGDRKIALPDRWTVIIAVRSHGLPNLVTSLDIVVARACFNTVEPI